MAAQPPKLTHVLQLRAHMSKDGGVAGKYRGGAVRFLAPLTGGFLKGVTGTKAEGLSVDLMPGGSDWLTVDPETNMAYLDVRTHGTDKDGKGYYIHYTGYLHMDAAGTAFNNWDPSAETTKGGDHHWWTNPHFETGNENYQWLTSTPFVGRGHWYKGEDGTQAVEYEIFELHH